ncbi:hypothetical protein TRFO_37163 [Tritrichomonas foetus]|uniref:Uncharacterized protein n=1 Tax=Tritrichomonas foetus TaxID=1144522 RepID=A0A1J4JH78_9EUKA|nr:hypothetical protein TRFO_37163 [Tritrichomonas foetus]|eukprot:OHS96620.1 hypothetical protein TRFO_37163 [Tritrichomonas foetus]
MLLLFPFFLVVRCETEKTLIPVLTDIIADHGDHCNAYDPCIANVSFNPIPNFKPTKVFCKFGKVVVQAKAIYQDFVTCVTPPLLDTFARVQLSFDGSKWSQERLPLMVFPYYNDTIIPLPIKKNWKEWLQNEAKNNGSLNQVAHLEANKTVKNPSLYKYVIPCVILVVAATILALYKSPKTVNAKKTS